MTVLCTSCIQNQYTHQQFEYMSISSLKNGAFFFNDASLKKFEKNGSIVPHVARLINLAKTTCRKKTGSPNFKFFYRKWGEATGVSEYCTNIKYRFQQDGATPQKVSSVQDWLNKQYFAKGACANDEWDERNERALLYTRHKIF